MKDFLVFTKLLNKRKSIQTGKMLPLQTELEIEEMLNISFATICRHANNISGYGLYWSRSQIPPVHHCDLEQLGLKPALNC